MCMSLLKLAQLQKIEVKLIICNMVLYKILQTVVTRGQVVAYTILSTGLEGKSLDDRLGLRE